MGFHLGDYKGPLKREGKLLGIREGAKRQKAEGGKILDLCIWWSGKDKKSK